jgi:hypothetical protein
MLYRSLDPGHWSFAMTSCGLVPPHLVSLENSRLDAVLVRQLDCGPWFVYRLSACAHAQAGSIRFVEEILKRLVQVNQFLGMAIGNGFAEPWAFIFLKLGQLSAQRNVIERFLLLLISLPLSSKVQFQTKRA